MIATDFDEAGLVRRLCSGDGTAFELLVSRYHVSMVRLARSFVPTDAIAEEVAQEAWLGALRSIERFEGRSTVKTWLFRILVNRARSRGVREHRTLPFSSLQSHDGCSIDPDDWPGREGREVGAWPGPGCSPARHRTPEAALDDAETRDDIRRALDLLPAAQRSVVVLRDASGFSAAEVCELLDLTETNQRVLLHRGRSKMRVLLNRLTSEEPVRQACHNC